MRVSQYFLPLIKENPSEAQIPSHRLMLRAGMIRQLQSGIYSWLPIGLKALRKLENIVRDELNKAGCVEMLMPTMQPEELWAESGRGSYGKETLKAVDRHDRTLIYGPTNEEVVTDVFRKNVRSFKQLPLSVYHIQWKFRDEIRPRFGVMRGREFLMKDAYSFTVDEESHKALYDKMYATYFKIFRRMGLTVIPFEADTGIIGGKMSHEFQVLADTGESEIFYDAAFEDAVQKEELDIAELKGLYAAADEKHDPQAAPDGVEIKTGRGIEVGHIFYLGSKYSEPMHAMVQNAEGKEAPVHMGCYGIGVSRLLGAIIEVNHDDQGIIWPDAVAPFHVGLINLRMGDEACDTAAEELYSALNAAGIDVLYDDSDQRGGAKFASMDLIGLPWQVVIGPKGVEKGIAEVKSRKSGEKQEVALDGLVAFLTDQLQQVL